MDLVEVRPTAWMDRWTVLDFCDQLALLLRVKKSMIVGGGDRG